MYNFIYLIQLSKSGSQSVYLREVDLNSAGTYRCEVSAEAPEFQTVEAEKEMKVFGTYFQKIILVRYFLNYFILLQIINCGAYP